jgi:hypothetical protein
VLFVIDLKTRRVHIAGITACADYLNAFAERFVRSIKHECLRHVVPLGEHHLRRGRRVLPNGAGVPTEG